MPEMVEVVKNQDKRTVLFGYAGLGSVILMMALSSTLELKCCTHVIFPIDRHSCPLHAFKRIYRRLTGAEATSVAGGFLPGSIIISPDQLSITPSVECGSMVPFSLRRSRGPLLMIGRRKSSCTLILACSESKPGNFRLTWKLLHCGKSVPVQVKPYIHLLSKKIVRYLF